MKSKKNAIQIKTATYYLADQSSIEAQRYIWSYDITIINNSDEIIQLLNRYWQITDSKGNIEEVKGPGVVGLQPIIKPGKEFAYSSFCQLNTPQGTMKGHYEMQTLDDKQFLVEIPKFDLTSPSANAHALRSRLH
ncbi:MAG: Co2+/Mg2+ efflux protein ApaG [Gammaproteobacteria bacterium]|nr:Co2+/Mg2+ efflux protein ApaG [Gammaproteobacteria bacterium]